MYAVVVLLPVRVKVAARLFLSQTCCKLLDFWGRSHTTCVSAEYTYMLWHVLIMKHVRHFVDLTLFLQSMTASLCYHDAFLLCLLSKSFLHMEKMCFLFLLFIFHHYEHMHAHTHTHTHVVTISSSDADSSWLTQVDLFPYPAAPVSPCSASSMHYSTT